MMKSLLGKFTMSFLILSATLSAEETLTDRLKPDAFMSLSPSLPVGYVADAFPFGFGGMLGGSITHSSIQFIPSTELRGGLRLGYLTYTGTGSGFDASLTLLPVIAEARADFLIDSLRNNGITPFATLGTGFSLTSGKRTDTEENETYSASSLDGLISVSAGAFYTIPQVPELDVFFETQYMIITETQMGMFLNFNVGATYRFYQRKVQLKEVKEGLSEETKENADGAKNEKKK